jgi:hypothetical protein
MAHSAIRKLLPARPRAPGHRFAPKVRIFPAKGGRERCVGISASHDE